MKAMPEGFVDLCYIDPPFYSQKDYKNIWGDRESTHDYNSEEFDGFKDTKDFFEKHVNSGAKGLNAYLEWLRYRLIEIHRILKPTGVFFLHLDYHAVHYAKVMLDEIFGYKCFQNEIIWRRKTGSNATGTPRRLPCNTDTILFYSKSDKYLFNPIYKPHDPDYVKKFYRHDDGDGRGPYQLGDLTAPSYSPTLVYKYKGFSPPEKGWRYNLESMKRLDGEGRVFFPKDRTGRLRLKRYLNEMKGTLLENIWDDIGMLQHSSTEKTGWSTQKPQPLLERIIEMCSNEGDMVFDCFAGCGTSMHAAHKLKRKWIGIDISPTAIKVNKKRLEEVKAKVNVIDEHDLVELGNKQSQNQLKKSA
jgi:site-specific DNA-methyltransferase (adenine-specific)